MLRQHVWSPNIPPEGEEESESTYPHFVPGESTGRFNESTAIESATYRSEAWLRVEWV